MPSTDNVNPDLNKLMNELVRSYPITELIESLLSACDQAADFAHLSNQKQEENYYRQAAVSVFDSFRRVKDLEQVYRS